MQRFFTQEHVMFLRRCDEDKIKNLIGSSVEKSFSGFGHGVIFKGGQSKRKGKKSQQWIFDFRSEISHSFF